MILESVFIHIEIFWKKNFTKYSLLLHLVEADTDRDLYPDRQALDGDPDPNPGSLKGCRSGRSGSTILPVVFWPRQFMLTLKGTSLMSIRWVPIAVRTKISSFGTPCAYD
jgi:hypothetical protein